MKDPQPPRREAAGARVASLPPDPALEAELARGQASFAAAELLAAHGVFREVHRQRPSDPRCASWYGLTLILVEHNNSLGLRYCEEAVRLSGRELPAAWLNLARAYRALGDRERAVKAVGRGLALQRDDPGLQAERALLGHRQRPVLPFLSRRHLLNRWLGGWRHRMGRGEG